MSDTKITSMARVALPTGLAVMTNEQGMVVMSLNDLVRALRQAALDGAAIRHFMHVSLAYSVQHQLPPPQMAKWGHMPAEYGGARQLQNWVAERYPLVTVTKELWRNRIIDMIIPPYGKVFFQVEAGTLMYRKDSHPDVPDNWKVCDIPVVAFNVRQLNLLRKLFKSPSLKVTTTEEP